MGLRRVLLVGCAVLGLLGACGDDDDDDAGSDDTDTTAAADTVTVTAEDFSGAAEVPGPGDADASGSVTRLEIVGTELCVTFAVTGLDDPAVAAHIHEGDATVAGPILVNLGDPADAAAGGWNTCVPLSDESRAKLVDNPAGHYLNVHTASFPDGAARAQLTGAS